MAELIGFTDGGGTLTTGGSNGNLLGMLCARQAVLPASTQTGCDGRTLAAFVSAEAHYSALVAAGVIGIGHSNLVSVACDGDGRMRPDALADAALARGCDVGDGSDSPPLWQAKSRANSGNNGGISWLPFDALVMMPRGLESVC